MKPKYFKSAAEWRAWLEKNHEAVDEVVVGYCKAGSGRATMTWSESVDEALCFGWIDGVRKSIDASRYSIRFCVRKRGSIWSNVNVAKVEALIAAGKMTKRGREKFEQRVAAKIGSYSYEQATVKFDAPTRAQFAAERTAWDFFLRQPPSYQKKLIWWVSSAKQSETRERRLAKLIAACAAGKRLI